MMWPALGKPNTTLSKEALDEKKANVTGEDANGSKSKHAVALASHLSNERTNGNHITLNHNFGIVTHLLVLKFK